MPAVTARSFDGFAHDLLAFGRQLRDTQADLGRFRLSRPDLECRFASEGYADVCGQALIANEGAKGASPSFECIVVDRSVHRQCPHADWADAELSVAGYLQAHPDHPLLAHTDAELGLWQIFDTRSGFGVQSMSGPRAWPAWEPGFPLRQFVHWTALQSDRMLLHAGTLGRTGKGILLCGGGGAGKSGTVLAGLRAGLQTAGDDYVLAQAAANRIIAEPLLIRAKQDRPGLERLGVDPTGDGFAGPNWQDKYEFGLPALFGPDAISPLELVRMVLLRRTGEPASRLRPASRQQVMMALAPAQLGQLTGGWRRAHAFLAHLARELPAVWLDLGTDIDGVVGRVVEAIGGRST